MYLDRSKKSYTVDKPCLIFPILGSNLMAKDNNLIIKNSRFLNVTKLDNVSTNFYSSSLTTS